MLPLVYDPTSKAVIQELIPPKVTQADWYVDWVNGDDANPGTVLKPVKTVMNGVVAHWGSISPLLMQNTTIHVVSAQPVGAEAIYLEPRGQGQFGLNIVQVPPVLGDPQLLASGVVLPGGTTIPKNRATGQKLTITLNANYPNGSIVVNTTLGKESRAVIQSMAGNVATMCQPSNAATFSFPDTWADGDTVNVIAPSIFNLRRWKMIDGGPGLAFTGFSSIVALRIPDPTGTPGSDAIVEFGGYFPYVQDCAIECRLFGGSDLNQGGIFFNCWNHPSLFEQNFVGSGGGSAYASIYGGSWTNITTQGGSTAGGSFCFPLVIDADAYVNTVKGTVWVATMYLTAAPNATQYGAILFGRTNVGTAAIWGPGQLGISNGGKLVNHTSLTWVNWILLLHANPIINNGGSTANPVNPATGVISPAVLISPANLDANGPYIDLAQLNTFGIS